MRFAVVQFPGSNCDQDCVHALQVLGQEARLVWHEETKIEAEEGVILPGGFSYGDYLRCGAIARFSPIMKAVKNAAERGQVVVGICNGFQILCEAGLLPGALTRNEGLHFRCEPTWIRVESPASRFTSHYGTGEMLKIPIAHGEGCYRASPEILQELEAQQRVLFRYCNAEGQGVRGGNPNGSSHNIAGICNERRNVLGLMPHPERCCEEVMGGVDGRGILLGAAGVGKKDMKAKEFALKLGLTEEEYGKIEKGLGREPNENELGMFSVMWSEHCSYKNTRRELRKFPTTGPAVLVKAGEENAGVVDAGDGLALAYKIESHNHPSAVEPFQGAATGVGGILRDIFTMGARPVAFMDSLRFGRPEAKGEAGRRTRGLIKGVVSGISHYGNCVGVPTVGGELVFDAAYEGNPLVNVFCLGTLRHDQIRRGAAKGVGNPVFYVGAKTGRDGLAGAAFASRDLTEESKADRPAVQVGDPFVGKLLFEACLELYARPDLVVGVQDMGAAGLTCSTCETASRGGSGIEIELDRVPQRETGMTPYEILLSESQERMLIIVHKGREKELKEIFAKWGLDAAEIGFVTETGKVVVKAGGKVVAEVPARLLADDAPVYEREAKVPAKLAESQKLDLKKILPGQPRVREDLLKLAASPATGSRRWVWNQYDHMVGLRTVVRPGGDAAVLRIEKPGGGWVHVAMTLDGNGRWCAQDPREGSKALVAEACRNLACAGAVPLGLTDNLNYGNPHDPEIFWQLREGVEGMAEACRFFDLPVTGGNVSLYNQSPAGPIHPTPVVGVVGKVEEGVRLVGGVLGQGGGAILLLGTEESGGLGASLYLQEIHGVLAGKLGKVDLEGEKKLHGLMRGVLKLAGVRAVHDVGEGGILWAVAEMVMGEGSVGAEVTIPSGQGEREEGALFGEGAGRILVEVEEGSVGEVERLAVEAGVGCQRLGVSGGTELKIVCGAVKEKWGVGELQKLFHGSLPKALESE